MIAEFHFLLLSKKHELKMVVFIVSSKFYNKMLQTGWLYKQWKFTSQSSRGWLSENRLLEQLGRGFLLSCTLLLVCHLAEGLRDFSGAS